MRDNISLHLTLVELAIVNERMWIGVIELRSDVGIVAQVISVVMSCVPERLRTLQSTYNIALRAAESFKSQHLVGSHTVV